MTSAHPYDLETDGVRIVVFPQYLDDHSDPEEQRYCYAYTITIHNRRTDAVQLLRRHWLVESNGSLVTEVKGDGVVGEQPILEPGDYYTYTSGTVIPDPLGAMEGFYFFENGEGKELKVKIPKFDLVAPSLLQ
jgi:ApaG protein